MDRNLALEFVRVTEAAAMAASKWLGRGDKNAADQAAVTAMRDRLNALDISGTIVIGEGDKDDAPMLFIGEKVGRGGVEVDIAVDPLECTTNCANGRPDSMAVLAAGSRGSLLHAPGTYMDQMSVDARVKGKVSFAKPFEENVKALAKALGKEMGDVVIAILDRDRNKDYVERARKLGCRIRLFEHGTIGMAIASALLDSGIDMMIGSGGAPEAVISAAGVRSLGGDIQAILKPHKEEYAQQARKMGITDFSHIFTIDELAKEGTVFVATGISDGPALRGVVVTPHNIITHSIFMRSKSGTVRFMETHHKY
ncbi:MAG: class II fructose-bisphosphatase [bacterium]|nr:class II fructose-bisphosphatase [bacterium]